jgi:DNA end-binding protein Ku
MARQLIAAFEGDFDATKYKDTYREALQEVIDAKRAGKQVHAADETEEDESPVDLMEALRQSITGAKTGPARGSRKPPASKRGRNNAPNGGGLNAKTKEELLRLAKRANIAGRSQMGKAELLKALRQTA